MPDGTCEVAEIKAVLAGNPNCGKSTIFNHLTGAKQTIGNFPGVTVDRCEGQIQRNGVRIGFIDLPGLYSTSSHIDEERVACDFLANEPFDLIINVVDASNITRNLYLTFQLRELKRPMIVVLNMTDLAQRHGMEIDTAKLSSALGIPVIETAGNRGEGLDELLDAVVRFAGAGKNLPPVPAESLSEENLSDSSFAEKGVNLSCFHSSCRCASCGKVCIQSAAADAARYREIDKVVSQSVQRHTPKERSFSDRIDAVLTNRYLGIPIFLAAMYLVFQLTFTIGEYPMNYLESGFSWLSRTVSGFWGENPPFLESLIVDGIIGGAGGVLVFLPNILLLFLGISLLEESGYLARAALLCDHWMYRLGLPGRSIIPLLIGFGCTVPALMATRMLNNRKERLVTLLILPLISCGARFPIYALLVPAFFPPAWRGPVLWLIYIIGIVLAGTAAKILSLFFLKGDEAVFIIELPPYHLPTFRTVGIQTLERGWQYLKKAGTILLGISIVLWFLTSYPKIPLEEHQVYEELRASAAAGNLTDAEREERLASINVSEDQANMMESFAGRIGRFLEPVIRPMGFDWKIGTALVGATAAKEVFVAQMGIIHSVGEADADEKGLAEILQRNYSPLTGFCMILFTLIATPCWATVTMMSKEAGGWKWGLADWAGLTILGWVVTAAVYQIGILFQ